MAILAGIDVYTHIYTIMYIRHPCYGGSYNEQCATCDGQAQYICMDVKHIHYVVDGRTRQHVSRCIMHNVDKGGVGSARSDE